MKIPHLTTAELEVLNKSGAALRLLAAHYVAQAFQYPEGSTLRGQLISRALQFRGAAENAPFFDSDFEGCELVEPLSSASDPVISPTLVVFTKHPDGLDHLEHYFTVDFKASDVLAFHGLPDWTASTETKESLADTYALHLMRHALTMENLGYELNLCWPED